MNAPEKKRPFQFSLRGLFIFTAIVSLVMAVLVVPWLSSKQRQLQDRCMDNVHLLILAIQGYHDARGCFPPAYIPDANGRPMHSWRAPVLPYMCWVSLYDAYNFGEPWNGPNNRALTEMPLYYRCPAADNDDPYTTSYVAVVGDETLWPGSRGVKVEEITDGLSNTIALLELADSDIHWTEPRDLTFDEAVAAFEGRPGAPKLEDHPGGVVVGFADGSVKVLSREFLRKHGKAMLTRAGGEKIPWPE